MNAAAVCFVHTCRFKCFFVLKKKKKRFLKTLWFPLSCDLASHGVKTTENITMLPLMMQTQLWCWRKTDTSFYNLSFRTKSESLFNSDSTLQILKQLGWIWNPVRDAVSETHFSQLLEWTRPSRLILFTVRTIATQTFTVSYKKNCNHLKYFNGRSSK